MSSNVLVVGGAGYIGSFTAKSLVDNGYTVSVLDNFSYGHKAAALKAGVPEERIYEVSLEDRAAVAEVLAGHKYDTVLHFAALTSVPESVAEPHRYLKANIVNSLRLFQLMSEHGVGRVVFSSTAATFGPPCEESLDDEGRMTEEHPTNPENPYGLTKLAIEEVMGELCAAGKLRSAVALRYFNACGASQDGQMGEDHDPETHLIPRLVAAGLRMDPKLASYFPEERFGAGCTIYGQDYPTRDGTCVRDYIHVEDLAFAHVKAVEFLNSSAKGLHVFNVGTGRGHSVKEVLEVVQEGLGYEIPHTYGPRRPGDSSMLVASSAKLQQAFGWHADYSLKDVVSSVVSWMRSNPGAYRR